MKKILRHKVAAPTPPYHCLLHTMAKAWGAGKRSHIKQKQLLYLKCITKFCPRLCRRALSTPFVTLFANKKKLGAWAGRWKRFWNICIQWRGQERQWYDDAEVCVSSVYLLSSVCLLSSVYLLIVDHLFAHYAFLTS